MLRGKSYTEYVYGRHARPLLHDLSSESSFNLIREWGHQSPLPTRVIDVSREDPHLFTSNGLKCPYITLSHCWGGEQPLITTKATLDERTIGIPMQSLPPLYCDAVIVTRRLGIQYLWIDSLCILQDCKDDWRKEAAKMGEIYRLSYVTLSALSAPNCRQGILIQRPSDPNKPTQSEAQGNVIDLRDRPKGYVFKEAPLSQRAWAVQERLLSPRILHYSTNELFWECLFCSARESNFRVIPSKPKPYSYDTYECMQVKVPLLLPLDPNPSYPVSSPSDWNIIVAEYTRCRLTLSSDKLPALSGLASLFQRNTRYTYLAGLWAEDLGNGLLWFCPDKQTQTIEHQVDAYRGPSWSWVSTDLAVQSITFRTPSGAWNYSTTEIKLLDFNIRHAGPDPLGEVLSAVITVQAFFYRLTYESEAGTKNCTVYGSGGDGFGKGILDAFDEEPGFRKQCAGLCIARRRRGVSRGPAPTVTYFLVVVPVLNAGEECWKRVGLAWTPWLLTHSAPEMSVIRLV
ncbi:HET-domain-containing protein [Zopfia rhizophila CBS 207.26]|uniref:HET-domain-containing protein n=1 Tax=Zopfia rhizophila CBS 207.26 TaxID=1314779 RepID=A0A6A6E5S8_9PEZI|nr:HET-domain-containing protein [Zopfia rhizophila CBS 207.26]